MQNQTEFNYNKLWILSPVQNHIYSYSPPLLSLLLTSPIITPIHHPYYHPYTASVYTLTVFAAPIHSSIHYPYPSRFYSYSYSRSIRFCSPSYDMIDEDHSRKEKSKKICLFNIMTRSRSFSGREYQWCMSLTAVSMRSLASAPE